MDRFSEDDFPANDSAGLVDAVTDTNANSPTGDSVSEDVPEVSIETSSDSTTTDKEAKPAKKAVKKAVKKSTRRTKKDTEEKPKPDDDDRVRYQAPLGWYILKVQVNREKHAKQELERRIAVAGLGELIKEVLLPTQKYTVKRGSKVRQEDRLLYPGYIMVHMQVTPESWFLIKETSGVGDFIGPDGMPTPLSDIEVQRMRQEQDPDTGEVVSKVHVPYKIGDKVRVTNGGAFNSMEGEVTKIDLATGRVTVTIPIFQKPTPIAFEIWDIEIAG